MHGVDVAGAVVITKKLRRAEVLRFFGSLKPCLVGMEACATAHFWAREISALGHEVRMMPPAYVKAYVRRQKNDAADAAAICEAVSRPSMRFVPVKSAERQSVLVLHRSRELLVRQRTMLINAIRGHCAEFGLVVAQGARAVPELIEKVGEAAAALPEIARSALLMLGDQLHALTLQIKALERRLLAWHRQDAASQRLATIPGVGIISATALAATVTDPALFRSGREFSAFLGLVPRQNPPAARSGSAASPRWETLPAQAPGGGGHLGDPACEDRRPRRRALDPLAAGAQARPRGHRGHGQQDRPHRLSRARARRRPGQPPPADRDRSGSKAAAPDCEGGRGLMMI